MQASRRSLLRTIAGVTGAVSVAAFVSRGQDPFPKPRTSVRGDDDEPLASANGKSPTKIRLEENQRDIKKDIEKLFDLAAQLKGQVEKTDATAVLSMAMVKKAEEIERLAHQIKELAKG
jgi:hypothetical protein